MSQLNLFVNKASEEAVKDCINQLHCPVTGMLLVDAMSLWPCLDTIGEVAARQVFGRQDGVDKNCPICGQIVTACFPSPLIRKLAAAILNVATELPPYPFESQAFEIFDDWISGNNLDNTLRLRPSEGKGVIVQIYFRQDGKPGKDYSYVYKVSLELTYASKEDALFANGYFKSCGIIISSRLDSSRQGELEMMRTLLKILMDNNTIPDESYQIMMEALQRSSQKSSR